MSTNGKPLDTYARNDPNIHELDDATFDEFAMKHLSAAVRSPSAQPNAADGWCNLDEYQRVSLPISPQENEGSSSSDHPKSHAILRQQARVRAQTARSKASAAKPRSAPHVSDYDRTTMRTLAEQTLPTAMVLEDISKALDARIKATSGSKRSEGRQAKPRGEAKQPGKSAKRPLFVDEVEDANGRSKYELDKHNNLVFAVGQCPNVSRLEWKSHHPVIPLLLYQLGYFTGNSTPKTPREIGHDMLKRYERQHGRKFWPCPKTDSYGRNIINKAENSFLTSYLVSKLGKDEAKVQDLFDKRPKRVGGKATCHAFLSNHGLHWTPPSGCDPTRDITLPSTTPVAVDQRKRRALPQLLPDNKRPRRIAPTTGLNNDFNIGPSLGETNCTDGGVVAAANEVAVEGQVPSGAPLAPMLGSTPIASTLGQPQRSNPRPSAERTDASGKLKLASKRKIQVDENDEDTSGIPLARAAKHRKFAHNYSSQSEAAQSRRRQVPPAIVNHFDPRHSLMTPEALLQSVGYGSLPRTETGNSQYPKQKRRLVEDPCDADCASGATFRGAKRQKRAPAAEAVEAPSPSLLLKKPSKSNSGYSSWVESPMLSSPTAMDQAELQQRGVFVDTEAVTQRDLTNSTRPSGVAVPTGSVRALSPDMPPASFSSAADGDDSPNIAIHGQAMNADNALVPSDPTTDTFSRQAWSDPSIGFDTLAAQLATRDNLGSLYDDDLAQLYHTVAGLDAWAFYSIYLTTPQDVNAMAWQRRSQYFQWCYLERNTEL